MTDTQPNYADWVGYKAVDNEGNKIGTIEEVYLDDESGQPEWLAINTGLFGTKQSFVPIAGAKNSGDDLQVAYSKDLIKDAPNVDPDGHLEPDEEQQLYRHYGRQADYDQQPQDGGGAGHDTSGPDTDEAMTRSEEELAVGTRSREAGRARLRKYIVTENVTETVPVKKETARIEREPITDANRDEAMAGGDLTEEEHEIVLSEEEIVVDKKVVPKERIRATKDVEVEDQQVSEDIRKEQIEVDDGTDRKKR